MKMTKTEWKYLQRIALDHPYYDTHKPPLTEAEARAIVAANNTVTGAAFTDGVFQKLGMTRPAASPTRFDRLRGLCAVPRVRRIAIVLLVVALLTVFFAATPVGRAIADSAGRFIVRLFENEITVTPTDDPKPEAESAQPAVSYRVCRDEDPREGFARFIEQTGYEPFMPGGLKLESVSWSAEDSDLIVSVYRPGNDRRVVVSQEWELAMELHFPGAFRRSADESNLYCATDEEDGGQSYVMLLNDSVIYLHTEGRDDDSTVISDFLRRAE